MQRAANVNAFVCVCVSGIMFGSGMEMPENTSANVLCHGIVDRIPDFCTAPLNSNNSLRTNVHSSSCVNVSLFDYNIGM